MKEVLFEQKGIILAVMKALLSIGGCAFHHLASALKSPNLLPFLLGSKQLASLPPMILDYIG